MLAVTFEANYEFVGVVVAVGGTLLLLARRGSLKITSKLGSIESAQKQQADAIEQVNRQVNHVEDPEKEPTLRELVIASRKEMIAVRLHQAAMAKHLTTLRKQFRDHLEVHQLDPGPDDESVLDDRLDQELDEDLLMRLAAESDDLVIDDGDGSGDRSLS